MAYEDIKKYGFDKITPEEQHKIAQAGGRASVKAARKRKAIRQIFRDIASLEVTDKTLHKKLSDMGISEDEITWSTALAVSTIMNAIKKGDVKTISLVIDLMENEAGAKKRNEFEEFMKDVD